MKRRAMFCTDILKKARKRIATQLRMWERKKNFSFGHVSRAYMIRRIAKITQVLNKHIPLDLFSYEAEERRTFVIIIIFILRERRFLQGLILRFLLVTAF